VVMVNEVDMSMAIRRTRRTLFLVVALYVALGLIVSAAGAFMGDRLAAFLGFLIVGGSLGTAAALNMLFRVVLRSAAVADATVEIKASLERIEAQLRERPSSRNEDAEPVRILNLASVGGGDPSVLAAATLDRDVYPRLVTSMGIEEPVVTTSESRVSDTSDSADGKKGSIRRPSPPDVAVKDMWRVWGAAMRSGDLPTCRRVYAALVDVADENAVSDMSNALQALSDRHEQRLRRAFGKQVREADYVAALRVGDEIFQMFPQHPLSDEFHRIKPILERKAASAASGKGKRRAAST